MPLPKIVAMHEAPFQTKEIHKQFCIRLPINISQNASIITHSHMQLLLPYLSLFLFCTCSILTGNGKQAKCCSILSCFDFYFSCREPCKSLSLRVLFNSLTKTSLIIRLHAWSFINLHSCKFTYIILWFDQATSIVEAPTPQPAEPSGSNGTHSTVRFTDRHC